MKKSLISVRGGEPTVSTFDIARGFNRDHKIVVKLVEKYRETFESMGNNKVLSKGLIIVTRKTEKAGRPVLEYMLNEAQAIFLGTLFRTLNKEVLKFKATLAIEFVRIKRELLSLRVEHKTNEYHTARLESVLKRRDTTDTMKEFVEYAENQGSKHPSYYYQNITKMVNSMLFIVDSRYTSLRSVLTASQLMTVASAEGIVSKALHDGMKRNTYYRDIYKQVKKNVMLFAELHGKTSVIDERLKQLSFEE